MRSDGRLVVSSEILPTHLTAEHAVEIQQELRLYLRMKIKVFAVLFVVLALLTDEVAGARRKRSKTKGRRKSSNLCRQRNTKVSNIRETPGSGLEVVAFFHFRRRSSGIACFKIQTCSSSPMCFVAETPSLRTANFANSIKLWEKLIGTIQGKRKLEPLNGGSRQVGFGTGLRSAQLSRNLRDVGRHPTVVKMCRNAFVFRFGTLDDEQPTKRPTTSPLTATTPQAVMPVKSLKSSSKTMGNLRTTKAKKNTKKRKNKHRRCRKTDNRNRRKKNGTDDSLCNMPCSRICVAPGKASDNFSECHKFRVSCKFDCSMEQLLTNGYCLFRKLFLPVVSQVSLTKQPKRHASWRDLKKFKVFKPN